MTFVCVCVCLYVRVVVMYVLVFASINLPAITHFDLVVNVLNY